MTSVGERPMNSLSERLKEVAAVGTEIPETGWAYHDGEFKPLASANVSIATHALNYGTGIFEGIRAYWNAEEEQLHVFRLRDHFTRMAASCRILRIELPDDADAHSGDVRRLPRGRGAHERVFAAQRFAAAHQSARAVSKERSSRRAHTRQRPVGANL